MKYKTLFRVLLKLTGVWLVASAIPGFLTIVAFMVQSMTTAPLGQRLGSQYFYSILGPLAQLAIGAYLFFGGAWIADLAIPGNRPYCHECGYDLTGAEGNVCNECGTAFRTNT
jgi:hypothetical protein